MRNAICRRTFWIVLLLLASPLAVGTRGAEPASTEVRQTAAPIDHGLHVLMTGHSFHWGIRPSLTEAALAAGLKDHRIVECQAIGGSRVIQHWQLPDEKNKAKAALKTGKVDVMTMSPHRKLPDEGIDKFVDLALQYNPDVRITVQQSWAPWDNGDARPQITHRNAMDAEKLLKIHAAFFSELEQQLRAVNQRCGKQVVLQVPVGRAVIALREQVRLGKMPGVKTQDGLFTDWMGHPGDVITALSAYCHFAVIYRRSPLGLPPPAILRRVPEEQRTPLARMLQELAWDTVRHDPLSGVP